MSDAVSSGIRIVAGQAALSDAQRGQFREVVVQGLQGKFAKTLQEDQAGMLKVVDTWIRYGFLPMDETFSAVDETSGEVLGILLLNNFKNPSTGESLACLLRVIKSIGVRRAMKIAFQFLELDRSNKELPREDLAAEIYLVATKTKERGKGIGTLLMEEVMASLSARLPGKERNKVKLLVFAKNPALRLYERLGFCQIRSVPTPGLAKAFGGDYDVLVSMEKTLA